MTTDVINGVPRELLERAWRFLANSDTGRKIGAILDAAPCDVRCAETCVRASLCATCTALLATAQPALCEFHDADAAACEQYSGQVPCSTAQPAADGERENHPAFDFLLGAGPLCGAWFGETPEGAKPYWWREHLRKAIAAQPQQAVAVTDEVRRLREALTRVGDRLEAFIGDDMDMPHDSMEVCKGIIDAALSAHKTGEEE